MKKIALFLAVLLFAAPAMAALSVSCSMSSGTVTVSYDDSGGTKARAFALDVQLIGDAAITGGPTNLSSDYYIYPGSIVISGGAVSNWGTAVAASDSNSMTIEMGSLYASNDTDHPSPPANSGNLFSFDVSGSLSAVTIKQNSARGGVVMEDGSDSGLGSPVCTCFVPPPPFCLKSTASGYAYFQSHYAEVGACWCYRKQCYGDTDGAIFLGKPVTLVDLNLMKSAFNLNAASLNALWNGGAGQPGRCADLSHSLFLSKPVTLVDLNIMKSYFLLPATSVPQCPAANYNFWMN